MLKLNIDGAARGNPGDSGCRGIVQNSLGEVIFAFSESLDVGSNNKAEMCALWSGLFLCYQLDILSINVETDSLLLVKWFEKITPPMGTT